MFSENKIRRKDGQWHSGNFEKLISEVPHIELPEMKIQSFTLRERMNDFEICDELGGNDKLCFNSKAEALRALGSTMTDEYRDCKTNIVYFLNEKGGLCYAFCRWFTGRGEWNCLASHADGRRWLVGGRVFYPAT